MNLRAPGQYRVLFTGIVVAAFLFTCLGGGNVYAQDNSTDSSTTDEATVEPPVIPTDGTVEVVSPYLTIKNLTLPDGTVLVDTIINGPSTPPAGFEAERTPVEVFPATAKTLANVPAFSWVFGCSAVSGSMIAGYYDRTGYANMYTGPTNAGVMPLIDTSWATWSDGYETYPNNPLIASHKGVDGRTTKGSIDDYWIKYGSTAKDPFITGAWTQHAWSTAVGDYMKTSQSTYSNTDGSSSFYNYNSATKLQCSDMPGFGIDTVDATYGRKLFYEARGYTVTDCYNEPIDSRYAGGFSFANFQAEINAGHPVMINLDGHTIVGLGYDTATNTVYIHDTWGNYTASMTWGGSYSNMQFLSVSIVNLKAAAPVTVPVLVSPTGTTYSKTPTYKWNAITGATKYQIQVVKGTTVVTDKVVLSTSCSGATCSFKPANTLTYAAYTWRARSYVGTTWSAYSASKSFTVSAVPVLVSPTGTITTTTPIYKWTVITGATKYQMQVLKGTVVVIDKVALSTSCVGTACSYNPAITLSYSTAYTWHARSYVGTTWSAYSASKSFTTFSPVPVLVSPVGTTYSTTPTYKWNTITGATKYQIQVLKGTTVVTDKFPLSTSCVGTVCSFKPTNTLTYAAYTWRVRSYVGTTWSAYSASKSFTVSAVPVLVSPTGTITTRTPIYKWTAITGATKYQMQVLKGAAVVVDKVALSASCVGTACSYNPAVTLSYSSAYTWHARSYVGTTWSAYSASKSFTTPAAPTTGFNSPFTADAAGWTAVNGSWSVGSGYYKTTGLSSLFTSSKHSSNYNLFTYEVKLSRTDNSYWSYGIFFNGVPSPINSIGEWNSGYMFLISDDDGYGYGGEYSIWRLDGGVEINLLPWDYSSYITSDWNTLKVTYNSSSGFVQFFINGSRVAYGNFTSYTTGQVGVVYYRDSTPASLYVDYANLALTAPSASPSAEGVEIKDSVSTDINGGGDSPMKAP